MEKLLNDILVPLALWENADSVIQKAIDTANELQCNLHLLLFTKATETHESIHIKTTIHQLYQPRLDPSLSLKISSREGQAEKLILEYYRKNGIDLILLARTKNAFWKIMHPPFYVRVNRLMKKINCPILNITIDPNTLAAPSMKNIVLPVGSPMPMRKLLFAIYLAKMSRSTIHLVSATGKYNGTPGEETEGLQKAYRLLRENTNLPVECRAMPGENLAEASWNYAKTIKADLILIGPGKESQVSGFLKPLSSRSLFNVSRIAVMTVA
jgi:hypothetical protein